MNSSSGFLDFEEESSRYLDLLNFCCLSFAIFSQDGLLFWRSRAGGHRLQSYSVRDPLCNYRSLALLKGLILPSGGGVMRRNACLLFLFCLLAVTGVIGIFPAHAQVDYSTATLRGAVFDPQGAVVAGTQVSATNHKYGSYQERD
jgi:hypothetical protein